MKYTIINVALLAIFSSAAPLARGTVDLVLVTSYNNIIPILSILFGKLTDVSTFQKVVGIHASTGTNVPISDSEINCQCFQDVAGTKTLGDSFTNIVPGTSLSDNQPVQIGSIFCSDAAGVKAQIVADNSASVPSPCSASARIQLDSSGEDAIQDEVPLIAQAYLLKIILPPPSTMAPSLILLLGGGEEEGKQKGSLGGIKVTEPDAQPPRALGPIKVKIRG